MIDRKSIPVVVEVCADNGEHSHFKLIDAETGVCLWEESETAHNSDYAKCHICKGKGKINVGDADAPDVIRCPECSGKGNFA